MLFLTKCESNLIVHGFCSPLMTMGWLAKILWQQNFFLHLWQDKPLWVESKIYGGVIFITILLHFHYFISLETTNTQKSEMFLLMWMHQLFLADILSFRKEFLETLRKCIYLGFWPQILEHLLWRTVTLAVSPPCSTLVNNT